MGRASYFNRIAADYDAHRPTYPDELIDGAVHVAGLGAGDSVLEVGPGTGQLTGSLLARGLEVTAVEPGADLVTRLTAKFPAVRVLNARLEDAELGIYGAAFAAAAFHWPDPDVSWRRVADALVPGGTFALISHFGVRGDDDMAAALEVWQAVAPDVASVLTLSRDVDDLLTGARDRAANLSEVWSWLGGYSLARDDVPERFGPASIATRVHRSELSATQLSALLATMSFWPALSAEQQAGIRAGYAALEARLGRPIRSHVVAVAVTAQTRHAATAG